MQGWILLPQWWQDLWYSHTQTFAGGVSTTTIIIMYLVLPKGVTSFIRFWLMVCMCIYPWTVFHDKENLAYHQNKIKIADWTPHLFVVAKFLLYHQERRRGGHSQGIFPPPFSSSRLFACHSHPKVACETSVWIDAYVCFFQVSRTIKVVHGRENMGWWMRGSKRELVHA